MCDPHPTPVSGDLAGDPSLTAPHRSAATAKGCVDRNIYVHGGRKTSKSRSVTAQTVRDLLRDHAVILTHDEHNPEFVSLAETLKYPLRFFYIQMCGGSDGDARALQTNSLRLCRFTTCTNSGAITIHTHTSFGKM